MIWLENAPLDFLQFFEGFQYFFWMMSYVDFWKNMRYLSIFVDDEGHSFCEKTSESKHTVGFGNFLVAVTQDSKWQIVFFRKFWMRFHTVETYPNYNRTFTLVQLIIVPETARFSRATWREVFRIKVQNHDFFPKVVFQTNRQTPFIR